MAAIGAAVALQKLGSHENKIKEVADHVKSLVSLLRWIHWLFIHSYASERFDDVEASLRYVAYKIEDILESFVVDVAVMLQENKAGFIRKKFHVQNYGFVIKNMKKNISGIPLLGSLEKVIKNFVNSAVRPYGPLVASQGQRWSRQSYPRGIEEHFVEMDDEFTKLIDLVIDGEFPVISIYGVTGLGKTTIASKIYKDEGVRRRFQAFAWVSLSHGCQISNLWMDILWQLSPRQVNETTTQEEILDQLKKIQSQKDCFIVLDNIQDMGQWTKLIRALDIETRRNRILITTPVEKIADVGRRHNLGLLNEDKAWNLLKKHAFPTQDGPDVGLFPRLGKEMVRKCGNLPSTICRLGRRLSSERTLKGWQNIYDDIFKYIIPDQKDKGDEQLVSDLDSNYANLPYYLKQCFLYLGNFSKDEEIDVEDVYFLWIAEGMISSLNEVMEMTTPRIAEEPRGEMTVDLVRERMEETTQGIANEDREETIHNIRNEEETTQNMADKDWEKIMAEYIENEEREESAMDRAEKYVAELESRGVLQVRRDELSATRRSQSCFLCSPARELSSWQQEKDSLQQEVIDLCKGKHWLNTYFFLSFDTRRLAINFDQPAEPEIYYVELEELRSLFLLNSGNKSVELPWKISNFEQFKLLRVLHFVRCKFDGRKLPKGIDRLFNLRYLGLLYCDLDELPSSISNLRNLRILNIRVLQNHHLGIPNVLCKLVLLNHLRLPYSTDRKQTQKLTLSDLLELEALFGFNSLMHDFDALSTLSKLRHLGAHVYSDESLKQLLRFIKSNGARIRTKLLIENKCDFISKEGVPVLEEVLMCPNIHALTLSMVLIYRVPDCGTHVSSDLTQLKLIGCRIKEDPMEALGKFPNLRKLCLGHGAFVGSEMTVQANSFPKLAYLEIRSLPYFEQWRLGEGAMRSLSDLIIKRCPNFKMIPDGLKSISNLNLDIELEPKAFENLHEEYLRKFNIVPTPKIRTFDPRSTS